MFQQQRDEFLEFSRRCRDKITESGTEEEKMEMANRLDTIAKDISSEAGHWRARKEEEKEEETEEKDEDYDPGGHEEKGKKTGRRRTSTRLLEKEPPAKKARLDDSDKV